MKKSTLKKFLKEMVRECLTEILAEEYIKTAVKKTINENMVLSPNNSVNNRSFSQVIKENVDLDVEQPKQKMIKESVRENILNKMGIGDDDPYFDIIKDTLSRGEHPLITGEDNGKDNPFGVSNQVSESDMRKLGLIK